MVLPERCALTTKLIALLQRNLMLQFMSSKKDRHCSTSFNTVQLVSVFSVCLCSSITPCQGMQSRAHEQQHKTTYTLQDWKLGLLMNIRQFPLDEHGQETTQLGLLMSPLDFLKIPMWPFIDEVHIMKPPKMMQLGVGYHHPKPVQVNRFMACIIISGDNKCAADMVWKATSYYAHIVFT